ncbi:MAG TPA: hypothetical protein VF407_07020 [Polyangiaceae bacterium]
MREATKIADASEKLSKLELGGAPNRPIMLESASLVEPTARSLRCPRCGGEHRVVEHDAKTIDGTLLRVVQTKCHQCGSKRVLYMRIEPAFAN